MRLGYQIEYKIRVGPFGWGIYTLQPIAKGNVVWKCVTQEEDSIHHNVIRHRSEASFRARLEGKSREEAYDMLDHFYYNNGSLNEILDDNKFTNHSDTPNTGFWVSAEENTYSDESTYALRDIAAGEEITENYRLFETCDWYERLCNEYGEHWSFLK